MSCQCGYILYDFVLFSQITLNSTTKKSIYVVFVVDCSEFSQENIQSNPLKQHTLGQ